MYRFVHHPITHRCSVRFHCNGWHTDVRYQVKDSTCRFCSLPGCKDSIQHFVECSRVQQCFPPHLKHGSPPRVPCKTFFLMGLDEKHQIAVGIFMFALYPMNNDIRHSGNTTDFFKTICRIMREVYMKSSVLQVWEEVFSTRLPHHPRQDVPSRPPGLPVVVEAPQQSSGGRVPPVQAYAPDTDSDINPFAFSHVPEACRPYDIFVPDCRSDILSDL